MPTDISCYVLTFAATPWLPSVGFFFGTGNTQRYKDTGGVDLLLAPTTSSSLYPVHGYFQFDAKYGQLWIHARHSGIRVDDRSLGSKGKHLLGKKARIAIGPYRFDFEFNVIDEETFQASKKIHLQSRDLDTHPFESTSRTPSVCDLRVEDWLLHGIVGSSPVSVIHAATNIKSGEVVALKRLRFGEPNAKAENEVRLYKELFSSIKSHRYSSFVMQKHSILEHDRPHTSIREVYLLWKPLARRDFSFFGLSRPWYDEPKIVKKTLFVQVLLGLSALHDCGFIHRDIKPENLGVVELGEKPYAVIIDEGQAIRQSRTLKPRPAHCGTIGYLAPELENDSVAPSYDKKVDVWSMGAVAYFLFVAGRIPWSRKLNMFLPELEAQGRSLHLFRDARHNLISHPERTFEHLMGRMLDECPQRRPDVQEVLRHPSIQGIRHTVDENAGYLKEAGQKRNLIA